MNEKTPENEPAGEDLLPEYDFSNALPNKYARRYAEGTNLVKPDPEIAQVFRDSNSVNDALRPLARMIRERQKIAS